MLKAMCQTLLVCAIFALTPVLAETPLKFDVDFPITVGSKQLPAGKYQVSFLNSAAVQVRNLETHESAIVITNATKTNRMPERGTLHFNRYGNHSFLSQIWSPGNGYGRQIIRSKTEVEMARRATQGVEVATVRANRR